MNSGTDMRVNCVIVNEHLKCVFVQQMVKLKVVLSRIIEQKPACNRCYSAVSCYRTFYKRVGIVPQHYGMLYQFNLVVKDV